MRRLILLLVVAMCLAALGASDCTRQSVGFIPLPELGAGLYQGMPGGLYPGGSNRRPAAHDAAGLRLAAEVLPRDRLRRDRQAKREGRVSQRWHVQHHGGISGVR